ncbi:MAG: arylsulfatase [Bryobacteraceae bacterium]|nr:arylsulfatase [Bryobacteraceae bacterium]
MNRRMFLGAAGAAAMPLSSVRAAGGPNIVLILADDVGWGDLGCYGARRVKTPNLDRLAASGVRFTDAHSPSATCTPTRYSLLTGEYAWRRKGTAVLPGDARLIIEPGRTTLPSLLKKAGYVTGCVGKWHLGLGAGNIDWNGEIKPGPLDVGFDSSFIIPATGDRVPCVYVDGRRVAGLDASDPIRVRYDGPVGNEPTGRANPELLKVKPSHGHDMTIVNGVSRIGYMTGGKAARWVDEDMADVITRRAVGFVEENAAKPFFLYFATHDIHVPRMPHARFAGKSGCGTRCDVMEELDWSVGELLRTLERLKLRENTLVLFTSDNGPVVDDGYADGAVRDLRDHKPAGPYRGGKYSNFEAGTRVPFLVSWPGRVKAGGVSKALVSQVDLLASFGALTGQGLGAADGPDSYNVLPALLGEKKDGRDHLCLHARTVSLREGPWKLIPANPGPEKNVATDTELGTGAEAQLYNLDEDIGERRNLAGAMPERVAKMGARLEGIRARGRSR